MLAILAAAAVAASTPAAQPAPLELHVNGVSKGIADVLLRGGDVLILASDLAEAGLRVSGGERETIAGRELVSLRSLAPVVKFEVDERALALRLTTGAESFGTSKLDLRPTTRPEGLVLRSDTSAYFNYAAQVTTGQQLSAFGEAAVSVGGAVYSIAFSRLLDGTVARGLTSVTIDKPDELRRFTIGEAIAPAFDLGGGGILAGVTVAREFSLDPYFVRRPLPRTRAVALTPSMLDVYVNGVLVRQQPLAPGVYDVSNLPVPVGGGSVRTVVRDAFGRSEELASRYYLPSGVLAKGISEYHYSAGVERTQFGVSSFSYGRPLLLARHRLGVTNQVTAGGRLELGQRFFSGGPVATFALSAGELEVAVAASNQWGKVGAAGSLGYALTTPRASFGGGLRVQSIDYANTSLPAWQDRALVQANAFASVPVSLSLTLAFEAAAAQWRDQGQSLTAELRQDIRIASGVTLTLTEGRVQPIGQRPSFGASASLTIALGERASADATVDGRGSAGTLVSAGMQRSLPVGNGFGYRLRASRDAQSSTGLGVFQASADHGVYEATAQKLGTEQVGTLSAAGSLVAMERALFFTRPVQEGFAIIQVPGLPGVRGYLERQEIGETDKDGNLLVPALLPYYGNRISIRDSDIPMEFEIGRTEQVIAAPWRGGARVRFEVAKIRSATGRVEVGPQGQTTVPAYGEIQIIEAGRRLSSPITSEGRFSFEGIHAGVHDAQVEHAGRLCRFTLVVPSDKPVPVELGTLRCDDSALATNAGASHAGGR